MKNTSELKNSALQQLKGNWGNAVTFVLVFILINFIANLILFIGNIFIAPVLQAGFTITFLLFYRGEKENLVNKLFLPFKDYFRYLGTIILKNLYLFLWSLLFIIPGIIKSFSYALTPYILKDNPDLKFNSAITKSREMMNGHKLELFTLYLSFIGWYLLIFLTMCLVYVGFTTIDFFTAADAAINPGALQNINNNIPVSSFSPTKFIIATLVYILPLISSLWLIPYIQTTVSAFYEELKNSETK